MLSSELGKPNITHHRLPVLILVCLFVLGVLVTAVYGLKGYQMIQSKVEMNHVGRTGLTYVAAKVRQANASEILIPDSQTLILLEEIDGNMYATSIFVEDGKLMESFGSYERDAATFKTSITSASTFTVEFVSDDLIAIALSDELDNQYETIAYIPQKEVTP